MEEGIEKAGEPKHRGRLGQVWAGFREGQLAEPELCFGKKGRKAVVTVRMEQAVISFQNSKLLGLAEVTASITTYWIPTSHTLDLVISAQRWTCCWKGRWFLQNQWTRSVLPCGLDLSSPGLGDSDISFAFRGFHAKGH